MSHCVIVRIRRMLGTEVAFQLFLITLKHLCHGFGFRHIVDYEFNIGVADSHVIRVNTEVFLSGFLNL